MSGPVCFHPQCIRGPLTTGHAVYRVNATGQPGIFACEEHRANTDAPRDPELDRITKLLESGGNASGQ